MIVDVLKVVSRRRFFIIVFTASFSLFTLIILLNTKLTYESAAVIRLMRLNEPTSGITQEAPLYDKISFVETHKNMLMNRIVLHRLVEALPFLQEWVNPKDRSYFSLMFGGMTGGARRGADNFRTEKIITRLRKSINLYSIKFTDLIEIVVRGENKKEVAVIANKLIDIYRDWLNEENSKCYEIMTQFLDNRLEVAKKRLERSEEDIWQFNDANALISIEQEMKGKVEIANNLDIQIADLGAKINYYKEILENLKKNKNLAFSFTGLTDNEVIKELMRDYGRLDMRIKLSRKYLKPEHPKYQELLARKKNLTDGLYKRLVEVFESVLLELQATHDKKIAELDKYKDGLCSLRKKYLSMLKLQRAFKADEETYLKLLNKFEESEVLEAKKSLVEIITVSPAVEPIKHILPKRTRTMILGTIIGFFMSMCIVLLQECVIKIN